jgi:hypothetical protein
MTSLSGLKVKASVASVVGGLVVAALANACSSSDPEPVPFNPLSNETGFCQLLAEAVCNATLVTECYGSVESTLADDTKSCQTAARAKFCNPEGLVYRDVNAQLCIDTYRGAYADAAIQQAELEAIADACHATLSGTGKSGDACDADAECNGSQGLECVVKPPPEGMTAAPGSCQIPEEVTSGMSCAAANQICADGFYCNADVTSCIVERAEGQSCSAAEPCDEDSRCVSDVCVAREANGQDCTAGEECEGGFCDIATGQAQGTCKAAQPINSTNGTCDAFLP